MSKMSDVRYGRRGGHEVPAGTVPGDALSTIERIRAEAQADGTWPGSTPPPPLAAPEGQLDLFADGDGS